MFALSEDAMASVVGSPDLVGRILDMLGRDAAEDFCVSQAPSAGPVARVLSLRAVGAVQGVSSVWRAAALERAREARALELQGGARDVHAQLALSTPQLCASCLSLNLGHVSSFRSVEFALRTWFESRREARRAAARGGPTRNGPTLDGPTRLRGLSISGFGTPDDPDGGIAARLLLHHGADLEALQLCPRPGASLALCAPGHRLPEVCPSLSALDICGASVGNPMIIVF